MNHYTICFLPEGSNYGQNVQRIVAQSEAMAVEAYKEAHLPDEPSEGTVVARKISKKRIEHEEKARALLNIIKRHGFTRWESEDEEHEIEKLEPGDMESAIEVLTGTDMQWLHVKTAGFTAAEVERCSFLLLWENEEVIADHTDNPKAESIAEEFFKRFNL